VIGFRSIIEGCSVYVKEKVEWVLPGVWWKQSGW
jgi:hypothetical protein